MRYAWMIGLVVAACGSNAPGEADAPPPAVDAAVDAGPPPGDVVASGLVEPYGIVLDGAEAYLGANHGDILQLTLATGAHHAIITGQPLPTSFAVTPTDVCWLFGGNHANDFLDGSVHCTAKTGGDRKLADAYMPSELAVDVDAGVMYWVEIDGGHVQRIDLDGTGQVSLAWSDTAKTNVAVTPATLAWTASGIDADVVAMDRATGEMTTLSTGEYAPAEIVMIGADVFWQTRTDFNGNGALRVSRAGAPPTDLVPGLYGNTGLLTDGTWLYYGTLDSETTTTSTVYRVLAAGGTPEVVVAGLHHASGLALDDQFVYWTEFDDGTVRRAER